MLVAFCAFVKLSVSRAASPSCYEMDGWMQAKLVQFCFQISFAVYVSSPSLTEKVDYNMTLHGCSASVLSVQFDSNVSNDVTVVVV